MQSCVDQTCLNSALVKNKGGGGCSLRLWVREFTFYSGTYEIYGTRLLAMQFENGVDLVRKL